MTKTAPHAACRVFSHPLVYWPAVDSGAI